MYGQVDCPTTISCLQNVTVSLSEVVTLEASDLTGNGAEFKQCDLQGGETFLAFKFFKSSTHNYEATAHTFDCSDTKGRNAYELKLYTLNEMGVLEEEQTCKGVLELLDDNDICEGLNSGYDLNLLLDCSDTDLLGIAGEFLEVDKGQNICVPFYTKNFTNIASAQGGITWNPKVLTYTSFKSDLLTEEFVNENDINNGNVRFAWSQISTLGESMSDGEIFIELCFNAIGNESEYSTIAIEDVLNTKIEFVSFNDEVFKEEDYCFNPAIVNINGNANASGEYQATLNGELIDVNKHGIIEIEESKIEEGENVIEFIPNEDHQYLAGVSTLDLVIGLKMFILEEPINPIYAIAMDVDYSGGINVRDLVYMRELILGIKEDLPHPGKFYLRYNHSFNDEFDEYDYGYFNSIVLTDDDLNAGQLLLRSYNYGDLNGTVNLTNDEVEVRSNTAEELKFNDKYLEEGETAQVRMIIGENSNYRINGLQTALQFQDVEVLEVEHGYGSSEFLTHMPSNDVVNLLFASNESKESIEFEIKLTVTKSGFISEMISLSNSLKGELVKDDLTTSGITLIAAETVIEDFIISPNPFSEFTQVKIPNQFIGGEMIVNDVLGKRIMNQNITNNIVTVNSNDLNYPGVYLVTLRKEDHLITKRVILN